MKTDRVVAFVDCGRWSLHGLRRPLERGPRRNERRAHDVERDRERSKAARSVDDRAGGAHGSGAMPESGPREPERSGLQRDDPDGERSGADRMPDDRERRASSLRRLRIHRHSRRPERAFPRVEGTCRQDEGDGRALDGGPQPPYGARPRFDLGPVRAGVCRSYDDGVDGVDGVVGAGVDDAAAVVPVDVLPSAFAGVLDGVSAFASGSLASFVVPLGLL